LSVVCGWLGDEYFCEDLGDLTSGRAQITLQTTCAGAHHEVNVGEGHAVAVRVLHCSVEGGGADWAT